VVLLVPLGCGFYERLSGVFRQMAFLFLLPIRSCLPAAPRFVWCAYGVGLSLHS
jgi:hypothetical protein